MIDGNLPYPVKDFNATHRFENPIPSPSEKKFLEKITIKPGQKLFEINELTLEIEEAVYENYTVKINSESNKLDIKTKDPYFISRSVVVKEGFEYIVAINKKNAIRKYTESKRSPLSDSLVF